MVGVHILMFQSKSSHYIVVGSVPVLSSIDKRGIMKSFSRQEIIDYGAWDIWFADLNFNHDELRQARSEYEDIEFHYCFDLNVIYSPQITSLYQGCNCSELSSVWAAMDEWIEGESDTQTQYEQSLRSSAEHFAVRELLMIRDDLDMENDDQAEQAAEAAHPIRIELWKKRWIWKRELNHYPDLHEGLKYSSDETFAGLSVQNLLRLSDITVAAIAFSFDELREAAKNDEDLTFYYDPNKNVIHSPEIVAHDESSSFSGMLITNLSDIGSVEWWADQGEWYECPIPLEQRLRRLASERYAEDIIQDADISSFTITEDECDSEDDYIEKMDEYLERVSDDRYERGEGKSDVISNAKEKRPVWRRGAIRTTKKD
jgi:hypothetical protein